MNKEIVEQYIYELCYKKSSSENPYLDVKDLKINKITILNDVVEAFYYFNLTSRKDPNIKMEIKGHYKFTKKDFIPYLRDKRLEDLLKSID